MREGEDVQGSYTWLADGGMGEGGGIVWGQSEETVPLHGQNNPGKS